LSGIGQFENNRRFPYYLQRGRSADRASAGSRPFLYELEGLLNEATTQEETRELTHPGIEKFTFTEIAHCIGYEWAMLLGTAETDWHKNIPALGVVERDPLRVVHLHARTELVWLHAYGELQ
jgi:hypothetical protein